MPAMMRESRVCECSRCNPLGLMSLVLGMCEFPFRKAHARLGDALAAQEGQHCWCQLRITDDAVRGVCHEQMLMVREPRGHFLGVANRRAAIQLTGYKEYGQFRAQRLSELIAKPQ